MVAKISTAVTKGPSPHTRGNPRQWVAAKASEGTIPAYAGEPVICMLLCGEQSDHPRIRGGTYRGKRTAPYTMGPSPHTRGNLKRHELTVDDIRTIPAYAGEPTGQVLLHRQVEDHPRIRGGTDIDGCVVYVHQGPSPHTRGNPAWG